MIQSYIIYDTDTGKIQKEITCNAETLALNVKEGQASIEGRLEDGAQYYIDGEQRPATYTDEQLIAKLQAEIREQREYLLYRSDWTQALDAPLTDAKKAEWATYRQALRDLPSQYTTETDINNVVYPTRPEA